MSGGLASALVDADLLLLQLVVEVTQLEGSMLMWLPPPPSDRLWISFMAPPKVGDARTCCSLGC